jgi:hypothetical protein
MDQSNRTAQQTARIVWPFCLHRWEGTQFKERILDDPSVYSAQAIDLIRKKSNFCVAPVA